MTYPLPISWDSETDLIKAGLLAPPMVCISWHDMQGTDGEGVVPHSEGLELLARWLDEGRHFIGLNLAYDWGVLCSEEPAFMPAVFKAMQEGRCRDLGIDQKLIDIAKGRFKFLSKKKGQYSLAGIAKRYGIDLNKEDSPRLTYGRLRGQPMSEYTEAEVKYALLDAQVPAAIHVEHRKQEQEWAAEHGPDQPLLAPGAKRAYAAFALHLASCWGVHTDAGRCRELEQELDRVIDEAADTLRATEVLHQVTKTRTRKGVKHQETKDVVGPILRATGTKNTKAATARMVEAMGGVENCAKTDGGGVSLDQEACEATGDPVLEAYSLYARSDTLRTRIQDLAQGSGEIPLQPGYGALQDTGRTSSFKPRPPAVGTQIQNMPKLKGSRETLEPRPGHIFIGADFDAAEMHTLAQTLIEWFGTSTLADTLNQGLCPHVRFGAALEGISYEQADTSPDRKKIRSSAKPGNFGIPGGMGAVTFQAYARGYGVNLTVDEARHHIKVFKENDPEIAAYLRQIGNVVNQKIDTVCLPDSGMWRGGLTYSSMANGFFQARCASGALAALCEVQRHCYTVPSSALYGCRIWGFIHDEILGEAPIDQAPDAALELSRIMQEQFNVYTPDVPTGAEPAIFWRWSKGTDPRWDQTGTKLAPSDPENAPTQP